MAGKKQYPEIMSINELRQYLKIRHSVVMELVESGQIPGKKINCRWRVHKQAVDNWLMGGSTNAGSL